jgi:acyl-CoA reductase-like NAD-dependent aldehyde dehydrogenase
MNIDWISKSREVESRVWNVVAGHRSSGAGDPLEKLSPRDGTLLYRFGCGIEGDVEDAVAAARSAFEDRRWASLPVHRRKNVLHGLASLIEQHREELALLESLDVGKPISSALEFDVPAAAALIRYSAEAADKTYGEVYAVDSSNLSYQLHRPLGVVGAIIGWNFPLLLAAGKIGPALATGNSLVVKPSELTSLSAWRIAQLAMEAGVPEGVLNVVNGGPAIGAALAKHPHVDLVTFTGSTRTGKSLLIASGQSNMKRLILECGGKSPNIVFDDCPDLEAVAEGIVTRAFWNQGQVCTASSRLLVHHEIKRDLVALIVKRVAALTPGDPLKEDTRFGAVVSQGHLQKVMHYIEGAEEEGARTLYRTELRAPLEGGNYVAPVIFGDVTREQTIAREEIFGPVLSVIGFRDEAEAISIANDTIYGLSAILWTKDVGRAHRVTQGIQAGWITVNTTAKPTGGPGIGSIPVGGHKQSGIGTEGGVAGLEEYMSKTVVQVFV